MSSKCFCSLLSTLKKKTKKTKTGKLRNVHSLSFSWQTTKLCIAAATCGGQINRQFQQTSLDTFSVFLSRVKCAFCQLQRSVIAFLLCFPLTRPYVFVVTRLQISAMGNKSDTWVAALKSLGKSLLYTRVVVPTKTGNVKASILRPAMGEYKNERPQRDLEAPSSCLETKVTHLCASLTLIHLFFFFFFFKKSSLFLALTIITDRVMTN